MNKGTPRPRYLPTLILGTQLSLLQPPWASSGSGMSCFPFCISTFPILFPPSHWFSLILTWLILLILHLWNQKSLHSFIHSLIHQIFIEHLLCASLCFRSGVSKLWPEGQIQMATCFHMAHQLRIIFPCLTSWEKQSKEEEYFVMYENYMKFKFQCLQIKFR